MNGVEAVSMRTSERGITAVLWFITHVRAGLISALLQRPRVLEFAYTALGDMSREKVTGA